MSSVVIRPTPARSTSPPRALPVAVTIPDIFGIATWPWGKILMIIIVLILIGIGVAVWLYFAHRSDPWEW